MRLIRSGLLVVLALPGAAFAVAPAQASKLVAFSTQARVVLDKEGKVETVVPDPALPAAVGNAVQDAVGRWRFAPPMKDGHAVGGTTFVQLGACAAPQPGGDYRFAVTYYGHGPARQGPPPRFPPTMMKDQKSAKMRVIYRVLANGAAQVDDIQMIQGQSRYLPDLRKAIQVWIGANTFQAEQLDGVEVTTQMALPVEFNSGGSRSYHSMAAARKDAERQAQAYAERSTSCQAAKSPGTSSEHEMALDSPFRLLPQG